MAFLLPESTVAVKDAMVKLDWKTESEVNNYGFEIERKVSSIQSSDSKYEKIGFVNGSGNSNSPKNYFFADNSIETGKYLYRLKQIDNDGKFEYSNAIEIDFGAPIEYTLNQNYANPFNPSTVISFSLRVAALVTLKIYDVLGNEVATILNSEKPAGVYEIEFNASELTSGIYFYQINSGAYTQTKKMLLIK